MKRRPVLIAIAAMLALAFLFGTLGPLFSGSPLEGELAPDFSLPIIVGEGAGSDRVRLHDLRGQIVVLDFWASWCKPCRESVPDLRRIQAKFADRGVRVIGINSETVSPSYLKLVGAAWDLGYLSLHDPSGRTLASYGVTGFPTVVVIDREGRVHKVYPGAPREDALEARITNLLD